MEVQLVLGSAFLKEAAQMDQGASGQTHDVHQFSKQFVIDSQDYVSAPLVHTRSILS